MSNQEYCFVIMPFRPELDDVYKHIIKPAISELGLRCLRADEIDGAGSIIRDIIEHIYDAKVIIADLTSKNANVFYELGIAHALGNNTIAIAQNIEVDVPFDVINYKVIQYTDSIRGGKRLAKDLKRAISSLDTWSLKPSNPVQDFIPPEAKQKVSLADYEGLQKRLDEIAVKFEDAQQALSTFEKSKSEISLLRDQNKELETYRNLLQKLFQGSIGEDASNLNEVVRRILEELESGKQVEVDVDSKSDETRGRKSSGKIIFKKISKK